MRNSKKFAKNGIVRSFVPRIPEQYLMHCRRQEESLLKLIPTRPLLQREYLRHTQLESFSGKGQKNNCFGGRPDGEKNIVQEFLPSALRRRVHIVPIGSDQAVLRQLAAHFREMITAALPY